MTRKLLSSPQVSVLSALVLCLISLLVTTQVFASNSVDPIQPSVITGTATGPVAQITSTGWITNPANGHRYQEINCASYAACETMAISESAHLVTINDQAEQIWLLTVFGDEVDRWIGFSDAVTEGQWQWANGEHSTYTNWAPGEPNNYGCDEDYALMTRYFGVWNDIGSCDAQWSSTTHAIIEKDKEPDWIFNPASQHWYKEIKCGPFAVCETMAITEGAHLVTINDQAEQIWLVTTYGTTFPRWIGYTDEITEGQWIWVSGEQPGYTNWAANEPNNWNCGEDYATLTVYFGVWNDTGPCSIDWLSVTRAFIEKPGIALLDIGKQAYPDPVQAGTQMTYTIRVTNTGDITLTGIVTDSLPIHVTPAGVQTWELNNLSPTGVWSKTMVVTVAMGYAGALTNVVQVTTLEGAAGIYTTTTQAQVTPALMVTKQANSTTAHAGELLTYTIRITNTGNITLTGIVTDTLPTSVTPTGVQTWTLTNLAPNDVWTQLIAVTVTPGYSGTLTNRVVAATQEGVSGANQVVVNVLGYQLYLPIILK